MTSHLLPGGDCVGMIDLYWNTGGFGEQLGLATSVHGDEPPGGLLDGLAYREQAMILQDGRLVRTKSCRDAFTLGRLVHDAGEVREESVVLVKGAGILSDGIEQPPERRP